MPLPAPEHSHLSFRGHLGSPTASPEEWQCGLNFDFFGDFPAPTLADVVTATTTMWAEPAMAFGPSCSLKEIRFSKVSATGAQEGPTTVVAAAAANGGSGNNHPWQDTLALTLVADGRGKGTKGRIYLPPQSYTVDVNTGLASDTAIQGMMPILKTWINALKTAMTGDLLIVGHAGITGPAGVKPVTSLRIGHVVDTMRSRRRSLAEAYVSIAL